MDIRISILNYLLSFFHISNFNHNVAHYRVKRTEGQSPYFHLTEPTDTTNLISSISWFEAKHFLTTKDHNGSQLNTFKILTSSQSKARQYLIDLNLRVINSGILPQARDAQFDSWLGQIETNDLIIILENFENLKKDMLEIWDQQQNNEVHTENKYKIINIHFRPIHDEYRKIVAVEVYALELTTTLTLVTDNNGFPNNINGIFPALDKSEIHRNSLLILTLTNVELRSIGHATKQFWRQCGVQHNRNLVLNDQDPLYIQNKIDLEEKLKAELRPLSDNVDINVSPDSIENVVGICKSGIRKRAIGQRKSGCAVRISKNGEVESIYPNEFCNVYNKGSPKAQQQLGEIVRQNPDKIVNSTTEESNDEGLSATEKMEKLVQLEQLKNHVSIISKVSHIENIGHSDNSVPLKNFTKNNDQKESRELQEIMDYLGHLHTPVKLSLSKISKRISKLAKNTLPLQFPFPSKIIFAGIIQDDRTSLAAAGATVSQDVGTSWNRSDHKFMVDASKLGKYLKSIGHVTGNIHAGTDIGLSVWSILKAIQRWKNITHKYANDVELADGRTDTNHIANSVTVTDIFNTHPYTAPIFNFVSKISTTLSTYVTKITRTISKVAVINTKFPFMDVENQDFFKGQHMESVTTLKSDYINSMKEETRDNNMTVKNTHKFRNGSISSTKFIYEKSLIRPICPTRKMTSRRNLVEIPNNRDCSYNLTLIVAPNTKVISNASMGGVIIAVNGSNPNTSLDLAVYSKEMLKTNVVFLNTSSSQIADWSVTPQQTNKGTMTLALESGNYITVLLRMMPSASKENGLGFHFFEEPEGFPYSVMLLSQEHFSPTLRFYHSLPPLDNTNAALTRYGCKATENVFDVDGKWAVVGGDQEDEFVLRSPDVQSINGRAGSDTLTFHENFNVSGFVVDMETLKFTNLENVRGIPGVPLTVKTSCDTILVSTQGGSLTTPDTVVVPLGNCLKRNTKIVVEGHTRVVLDLRRYENDTSERKEEDLIHIVAHDKPERPLQFELDTKQSDLENVYVEILTSYQNWKVVETKRDIKDHSVFMHLAGRPSGNGSNDQEYIKLTLKDTLTSRLHRINAPSIRMTVQNSRNSHGILVIEPESLIPKIIYELPVDSEEIGEYELSAVRGMAGLSNVFVLPMTNKSWMAFGGHMDDTFVISPNCKQTGRYDVDGGEAGVNTLVVETDDLDSVFTINMVTERLGCSNNNIKRKFVPVDGMGSVKNVHQLIGQSHAPDHIYSACDTRKINGRGGKNEYENDFVFINNLTDCFYDLMIQMKAFTSVINEASTGNFTYYLEDITTSHLIIQPTATNMHVINFAFHPWEYIDNVQFNKTLNLITWTLLDSQTRDFKLEKALNAEDSYTNPIFTFHSPESQVYSNIHVSTEGLTMATFVVVGLHNPTVVQGLPVEVNKFIINITATSSSYQGSKGSILGVTNGTGASQFWIINLKERLELLDGGTCNCNNLEIYKRNSLRFGEEFTENNVTVKLDINNGTILMEEGTMLVNRIKNIHEFYGRKEMTAYTACETRQVSNVGKVVVIEGCQSDLIIGLQNYTEVWFEGVESINVKNNKMGGTIHYIFDKPMSFEPRGCHTTMSSYHHVYHLPFHLSMLDKLRFDIDDEVLFYTVDYVEYNHSMFLVPGIYEAFYPEPSVITKDGYKLRVGRDGSVWAILGDTPVMHSDSEFIEMSQETANRLGVTIQYRGSSDFYQIGHSLSDTSSDRNVFSTLDKFVNHFAGGGAADTFYEIKHLNRDVIIHTGYSEDTFEARTNTRDRTKQTIDLTDIVVPIRKESRTKYVPELLEEENGNLKISMMGYESRFPGSIIIVNGSSPWIAARIQLLLSNVMMDLVNNPVSADLDLDNERERFAAGRVFSSSTAWLIRPRPIIIPSNVAVFSMSPDDLEDGQSIQFGSDNEMFNIDANTTNNYWIGSRADQQQNSVFSLVQNGSDLYWTNVPQNHSLDLNQTFNTVVFTGLFQAAGSTQRERDHFDDRALNIIVNLPGISLTINDSHVITSTERKILATHDGTKNQLGAAPAWGHVLHRLEERLLVNMPEVRRTFRVEEYLPWWKSLLSIWIAGTTLLLLVSLSVLFRFQRARRQRSYKYTNAKIIFKELSLKRDENTDTLLNSKFESKF